MKEAEQSKPKIDLFNYGAIRLMQKTPADVIYELGIRVFTGSRDVPKDVDKAWNLIQIALQ